MISDKIDGWLKKSLQTSEKVQWQWTDHKSAGGPADIAIAPGEVMRLGGEESVLKELNESKGALVEEVVSLRGFINIKLLEAAFLEDIQLINSDISKYLTNAEFAQKRIIFDYSAPNIAKPFSVGHLRSTVIGQANLNIHRVLGYETTGVNHIGDWGTQFGKLIYAVKTWGDETQIDSDPITQLVALYQKFHKEAQENPQLDQLAAEWFRKLELHDEEATKLWEKCIKWSFAEFDRLYNILNIKIDETKGESFYADKTDAVIAELKEKGLLKESEGAQIVELEGMPPAIIQKSNESTLYLTRDLAVVKYRLEEYKPDEIIYHVGNDQHLHFQQLFAVVCKLGWAKNTKLTFAGHGMIRLETGKMSTRAGRVVLLDDLIMEANQRVRKIFSEHNEKIDEDKIQKIAISSIKYADLSSNRKSDVVFSFDRLIDLKGNSAVYLEYTYARISSIVREAQKRYSLDNQEIKIDENNLSLSKKMVKLPSILGVASENQTPNALSEYLFELCNEFNNYYEKIRIITENEIDSVQRANFCRAILAVLGAGMDMLGVEKFEEF